MQEEIRKHSRKTYKAVKNSRHTVGEKVKEIIIEIFIIVFAVSLSIWLHGWSEHRNEQKEANKFLKEIITDLTADIKMLEHSKDKAVFLRDNYNFILALKNNKVSDSIIGPYTTFSLLHTDFNVARYEGFKSSGKIGTIEDGSLKNDILSYYQQTVPGLIFFANFFNELQVKMMDEDAGNLSTYDFFTTRKMQGKYNNLRYNAKEGIEAYDTAIKQVKEIIKKIESME